MTNATEYLTETLGTRKTPLITPVNPLNPTVDSVPNE